MAPVSQISSPATTGTSAANETGTAAATASGTSAQATANSSPAATGTAGTSPEASATAAPVAVSNVPNMFANASFETPAVSGYSYTPDGSGWTFTNNAGIQANSPAYGAASAPDGNQTALLQGINGTLGTMSQSVNFTSGTYTISFQAAMRRDQVQPIQITVDGTAVGTYTPATSNFAPITTAPFTVTTGTHTITFAATDSSADKTTFIDQVSIANSGGGTSAPAVGQNSSPAATGTSAPP